MDKSILIIIYLISYIANLVLLDEIEWYLNERRKKRKQGRFDLPLYWIPLTFFFCIIWPYIWYWYIKTMLEERKRRNSYHKNKIKNGKTI